MNALFEGDLIRPLGVVTLYFGYAEYEVNELLDALNDAGAVCLSPRNSTLGQKLGAVRDVLARLPISEASQVISLIDTVRPLVELRNALVHSCILAKGRVVPHDKMQPELTVTPEQLNRLAEDISDWRAQLGAAVQLRLMPALLRMKTAPNQRLERP